MTREAFAALPALVLEHHVVALGYSRQTVAKFVDCGVLSRVQPAGATAARYRKRQLALLLEWFELAAEETRAFAQEPPLLDGKAVRRWTGWGEKSLARIVRAGGLRALQPPGASRPKFRKNDLARLLGLKE